MKRLFLLLLLCSFSFSVLALDIQPSPLSKETRSMIAKDHPTTSKKLILYYSGLAESTCPHVQFYFKSLKKMMQKPKVQEIYTLKKQPDPPKKFTEKNTATWNALVTDCGAICVVSLKDNWIYKIEGGHKEPDVKPLMDILDALAYQ